MKVAPFTFYDESYDELSGEYIFDHYLISHSDFIELFTKYNVSGNDISKLKEYGLISGGGTHEIVVRKDDLVGFQNDNLVLAFTTDSDEVKTFEYSAFHLTDAAKALIEILEIETSDEFFLELAYILKAKVSDLGIEASTHSVEGLT